MNASYKLVLRWFQYMSELIRRLGDRICQIRKEKQLSQKELGELSGLHPNYIGQAERGEKNVTIESLEKIVVGLGISMEHLFRYIDPVNQQDELGQINELLSSRSDQDRAMVLHVIKNIFNWELSKYN